jgi:hypothetical protein
VSNDAGSKQTDQSGSGGFIERIIEILFGGGDPERQLKRTIKSLGKQLTKEKYTFYKPRSGEMNPAFARFLYEIYKTISVARKLVQPTETGAGLKFVAIESKLSDKQRELRDQLDEKAIRERARGVDVKELASAVKDTMINFVGTFDSIQVKAINGVYNQMVTFITFCHFDFYFTLKKFDSAISEDSFSYKPKFDSISADYVVDDIRDFLDVAISLSPEMDWDGIFDLLQAYRGVEVVDRAAWSKITKGLFNVLENGVLVRIVQHASRDPYWTPRPTRATTRVIEPYLNEVKSTVEGIISKIVLERRNSKIDQLVQQVFGTTVVTRTKNYTAKASMMFQKGNAGGYQYTDALNYLKAYLLDFFKKDVREIIQDLLIVRGKWTTNIQAQQISDAYHGILANADQIITFDDSLEDEGDRGQRLRRAMGRVVERDPSSQKPLVTLLTEVNGEASRLINEAAQNLIIIGKSLKLLIEDIDRKEHEMILNWKELDNSLEESLKERMTAMYRQIYYLVQLLQVYSK